MDSKGDDISPERAAFFAKFSHGVNDSLHFRVIDFLKHRGVAYVVSPYESDAQLGFMYATKQVTMVLSEDSDLFVYGVRRLMKSLKSTGECKVMDLEKCKPNHKVVSDLLQLCKVISRGELGESVRAGGVRLPRERQGSRNPHNSRIL